MATATKPNEAGLYFVDAAGRLVPEGSPEVVQQFDEEGLRAHGLGHYATGTDEEKRLRFAEAKATALVEAERERQAQLAAAATPSQRERELESRIAALEAEIRSGAKAAKATTGSATKAVAGPPEDK